MTDTEIQFDSAGFGPVLHKRDSKGKHRIWQMQLQGNRYRTLSGLATGKQAESEWTTVLEAKSQDTPEKQAEFEVRAKYQRQLDREYHRHAADIDTAKMIEPMLAKTYGKFPGDGYAQPKLDGMRCIMTKDGMFTRQGRPITAVPHLHAGARALFEQFPDAVLDGELYNHDLRDDFQTLMSICRKKSPTAEQLELAEKMVQYHVYDCVMPGFPFPDRLACLHGWDGTGLLGFAVVVDSRKVETQSAFDNLHAEWIGEGYEGSMLRPWGDPGYQLGSRSKFLLKRKDFETEEFPFLRWEEGQGNWSGAIKRFILEDPKTGKEFGAGVRGSYDKLSKLLNTEGPSEVTVRFFGRSNEGVPRFPVVVDMHYGGRKD